MRTTPDRFSKIMAVGIIMICLGFAAFTRHAWEDYFITFRASLNLATGHGLVFQPGERVHSFTSPLGTLLPALFALGGGEEVEIRALWWFRLASALALGIAVFLAAQEFRRNQLVPWAAALGCGLWIFDSKIIDFSSNGMETALLILFVVLTWRALVTGAKLWPLALSLAGLQWTRPDGFIFFGALALAWLCLREKSGPEFEASPWRRVARAAAVGAMICLPWVVFAWLYYGSPIPHTILAKQQFHPLMDTVVKLGLYPLRLLGGRVAIHDMFMPTYFFFGGWPAWLAWFARLLGVGAALTWLWPKVKPSGRIASAALFVGGFYLEYIPVAPWYFPGWQVLACIAWAYLLDASGHHLANAKPWKIVAARAVRITAHLLLAFQVILLIAVGWQMRTQQILIEDNHRHEIGRWLQHNAAHNDRVYLEPLGYIGFYSGLKMLDNPGLSSPEVVAERRSGHNRQEQIIQALQPEWLVLRLEQVENMNAAAPSLLTKHYRIVRVFNARESIDAVRFLPGRGYLNFDARFFVFARADVKPSSHGL